MCMQMMKNICTKPFYYAEIAQNGDIYPCCPGYCNRYSFGNLRENTLEEIWHGEKAQQFRNRILNGDYSGCNLQLCPKERDFDSIDAVREQFHSNNVVLPPMEIVISYDTECNVACTMCRPSLRKNDETLEARNALFQNRIWGSLQSCRLLYLSGAGDPFGSRYGRALIERAGKEFPALRFDFITNGVLLTKSMYDRLNLDNKIRRLAISVHAATAKTYDLIVKHSSFHKVMNNIAWLAEKKRQGAIDSLSLLFVVSHLNYREIPDFAELAREYGSLAFFTTCRELPSSLIREENFAVWQPEHPEHDTFFRIMQSSILHSDHCWFDGLLSRFMA